jgi:DNA-binding NtrC family response regulator
MRRKVLDADALALLSRYEWRKNNVRELRNVVERMLIASDGETIGGDDVPSEIAEGGAGAPAPAGGERPATYQALKAVAERMIVSDALRRNEGHITRTAAALGLADHASLLKIMRRLGVERDAP